jgi:hypothetical protein
MVDMEPVKPIVADGSPVRIASRSRGLAAVGTGDLLSLYGEILTELRERGVVRSENSPVGDVAEYLAGRALGLKLETNSSIGYDCTDAAGLRYQIKGRRLTRVSSPRQLGAIRGLADGLPDPFDLLVGILFNGDMSVRRAALIPIAVVRLRKSRQNHVNAWRLMLTETIWMVDGVVDITEAIRAAALEL